VAAANFVLYGILLWSPRRRVYVVGGGGSVSDGGVGVDGRGVIGVLL